VRYAFIKKHHGVWAVGLMAGVLAVSVSGFYAWLRRGKSKRAQDDETLTEKIVMFYCGELAPTGRALPVLESLHLRFAAHP
jgi:putative transposase